MAPIEIQWCDHSAVLLEYLRQLYEDGRFVDVGLECEGKQVKAHKAVISACSPYLEGLLKGNPARSHLIKFNGYSYNSLKAVIDFMYNGKVLIDPEHLAAFLKLGRALQVRGIQQIATQCEEAGLTTAEETKSNAQYSTSVQQNQKLVPQSAQSQNNPSNVKQSVTETKKYAFMANNNKKQQQQQQQQLPTRKPIAPEQPKLALSQPSPQQPVTTSQPIQTSQLQEQQAVSHDQQSADSAEVDANTLAELQAALESGQAVLQTDGSSGDTLQMMDGQCIVTGSGQTYVVVQEGDQISFVPAEMVQAGDLAVNGGQGDEQQMVQMDGKGQEEGMVEGMEQQESVGQQEATEGQESLEESAPTESLETMSVVESLVKLGENQPAEGLEADQGVTSELESAVATSEAAEVPPQNIEQEEPEASQ